MTITMTIMITKIVMVTMIIKMILTVNQNNYDSHSIRNHEKKKSNENNIMLIK